MGKEAAITLLAFCAGCIGTFFGAESTEAHSVVGRGGGRIKISDKVRVRAYVVTNLDVSDHTAQKVRLRHLGGGFMFEVGGDSGR